MQNFNVLKTNPWSKMLFEQVLKLYEEKFKNTYQTLYRSLKLFLIVSQLISKKN